VPSGLPNRTIPLRRSPGPRHPRRGPDRPCGVLACRASGRHSRSRPIAIDRSRRWRPRGVRGGSFVAGFFTADVNRARTSGRSRDLAGRGYPPAGSARGILCLPFAVLLPHAGGVCASSAPPGPPAVSPRPPRAATGYVCRVASPEHDPTRRWRTMAAAPGLWPRGRAVSDSQGGPAIARKGRSRSPTATALGFGPLPGVRLRSRTARDHHAYRPAPRARGSGGLLDRS
jgi:hypothetical protein